MPKRWIVTPIIGSGQRGDAYRVEVWGYPGLAIRSIIPADPVTGAPLMTRTLALVEGTGAVLTAAAAAFPNTRVIPAALLDDPLSSLTANQRDQLRDFAGELVNPQGESFDYTTMGYTGATLLRRVIRDMGKFLDPGFDEGVLDQ